MIEKLIQLNTQRSVGESLVKALIGSILNLSELVGRISKTDYLNGQIAYQLYRPVPGTFESAWHLWAMA